MDEMPSLTDRWAARCPTCEPIGHELRQTFPDRWVRFRSLPGSQRYPQTDEELAEVLFRHNAVLSDLITVGGAGTLGARVIVVTCSWSGGELPTPRDPELVRRQPAASFWRSVSRGDPGFDSWIHLWASELPWETGCLDDLLELVATDGTDGVIVAEEDFAWLYHPYDGGGDAIAPSASTRERLARHRRSWMFAPPDSR